MSIEQLYQVFLQHPLICTDTRKIIPGCLFFALKGEKFDANAFAGQAIEQGAAFAVVDSPSAGNSQQFIRVTHVLTALQNLAKYHRQQLGIPVIGLTGSNGKTTTKELIHSVLSQKFKTYATAGNLNNHIGVPLTILSINAATQIAVIEMGANHQREIAFLCEIAQPTAGLITNIGKAHLEGFGGVEGIKKGKGELFDFFKLNHGAAMLNADSPALVEMAAIRNLIPALTYGKTEGNDVQGDLSENSAYLKLHWRTKHGVYHSVQSQLTGAYNLDNILAAISLGIYFNLSPQQINAGISSYQPVNNRSQIVKTPSNTLICDYYNANPTSMFAALDNIEKLQADNKRVILGDMFELGEEAAAEHEAVIVKAMQIPLKERIFIGHEFEKYKDKYKAVFYNTAEEAIAALTAAPIKNATILIKGSRGMALERLVGLL